MPNGLKTKQGTRGAQQEDLERSQLKIVDAPPSSGAVWFDWLKTHRLKLGLVMCGVIVLTAALTLTTGYGHPDQLLIYYTVQPTNLEITVTERGNLESQQNVKVICEVDDVDGDGIDGIPILWIIPNGASVKKGDLLVELMTSHLQDRYDDQILDTERATNEQIQAKVAYENQITQNETARAEAHLQVDLAQLALDQYEDEQGGTFQLDLQNIELIIQEAKAQQLIEETNLEGVTELFDLGYRSTGELAQARLTAMKARRSLANAEARKRELVEYQYRKTKLELQGALASAKRALQQVERDNEAELRQALAATEAADESLTKEMERLERYRSQLEKCKIYAPQDGMVAYTVRESHYRSYEIRAGATVRMRQQILTLPNLSRMQVKTAIHESVLDQIKPGMDATVRVDPFPDQSYNGSVKTVAVLPDQDGWRNADTKIYETIVTIDEDVEQLKPGMTAVVDIHVDQLESVLSVPVQAIVQLEDENWCYVDDRGIERRNLELGRSNDKFVEILSGLEPGDRVVLNPMAILDQRSDESTQTASFGPPDSNGGA